MNGSLIGLLVTLLIIALIWASRGTSSAFSRCRSRLGRLSRSSSA